MMLESYLLYREGLANELMFILQRCRKAMDLNILDRVNIGLVQGISNNLTDAIYLFVDEIIKRVRIVKFSPNPLPDIKPQTFSFRCHFKRTFTFDVYMEVVK